VVSSGIESGYSSVAMTRAQADPRLPGVDDERHGPSASVTALALPIGGRAGAVKALAQFVKTGPLVLERDEHRDGRRRRIRVDQLDRDLRQVAASYSRSCSSLGRRQRDRRRTLPPLSRVRVGR
jgi:hypothetical protein